jgi:hypothetical protein
VSATPARARAGGRGKAQIGGQQAWRGLLRPRQRREGAEGAAACPCGGGGRRRGAARAPGRRLRALLLWRARAACPRRAPAPPPPPAPRAARRQAPKPWSQQQQQPPAAADAGAPPQQQQQQAPAAPSAEQRRGFALAIARKLEGRVYNHRNDVVANNFDGLADYLIKVVPKWIKFAVAGPAQSNDDHNEVTLYSTPEGLLPLMR